MSKKFLLITLMLIVFSVGFSGYEVQDNFEDGDASGWNYNDYCGASKSIDVFSNASFNDNYGIHVYRQNGGDCIITKSISATDNEYSVWYYQNTSIAGFQELNLNYGGPKIMMRVDTSGFVCYTNTGGWTYNYLSGCGSHPQVGTWYRLKIEYTNDATTASCLVYDDNDDLICSQTGQSVNAFTPAYMKIQVGDNAGSINYWDNVGYLAGGGGGESDANEEEGRLAIDQGIRDALGLYTPVHTNKSIFVTYANGTQTLAQFDKVAKNGTQTWAFNYITSGESYVNLMNITNVLYTWENQDMTSSEINSSVSNYITATKE